jgi:malonyl-CoA O-methyltransferase
MLRRVIQGFRRRWHPAEVLPSLQAYALWAEAYPAQAHNAFMMAEQQAVESLLPVLAGLVVLDLACGSGRYSLLAESRGAAHVFGLDNSLPMLKTNTHLVGCCASVEQIPLPGSRIDVVICGLALGHVSSLRFALAEIGRVLKPGGFVIISDFHPYQALTGGQRTFGAGDGQTYAVEHHVHLAQDYFGVARESGLRIDAILEPTIESSHGVPVAIVYRFQKRVMERD